MYFAAVVDRDWKSKGVLLVTFDTEEDEQICTVVDMHVRATKAGLYSGNLQVSNVDWEDYRKRREKRKTRTRVVMMVATPTLTEEIEYEIQWVQDVRTTQLVWAISTNALCCVSQD